MDDRAAALELFASFPDRLDAAAEDAAGRPLPDGEWSPVDVVRHLIAVEREVWWARFESLTMDGEPHWGWVEPGLEPGLEDATLSEAMARHAEARAHSVATLTGFDEAAWARIGVHATYGRLDAVGLLRIVSAHDAEHLEGLSAFATD